MARNDVAVALTSPREEPIQFAPEPDWRTKKRLINRRQARLVDILDDMGKLPSVTQTTITEDGETTSQEKLTPDFRMTPKPGVHGSYSPGLKNSILWETESVRNKWPHFYEETMPHEVAHAGAALANNMEGQGHGEEWETLMGDLQRALMAPDTERARELREAQIKARREWMANNPEARKLLESR